MNNSFIFLCSSKQGSYVLLLLFFTIFFTSYLLFLLYFFPSIFHAFSLRFLLKDQMNK